MAKPVFEKVPDSLEQGVACEVIQGAGFGSKWHFHPELQFTLISGGAGYRLVGDDLRPFHPGDVVFVGADLPHVWQADAPGLAAQPLDALIIQFREDCLGPCLREHPAFGGVRKLLRKASLGLELTGTLREAAAQAIVQFPKAPPLRRLILLMDLLDQLARSDSYHTLASPGYAPDLNAFDEQRVQAVCEYLQTHLAEPVYLAKVAALVHMSEGAFSRFFRSRTGRTFSQFVSELRVGRACQLLATSDLPISEIAWDCGFGNLSLFNRQFRALRGMTPRTYRRSMQGEG